MAMKKRARAKGQRTRIDVESVRALAAPTPIQTLPFWSPLLRLCQAPGFDACRDGKASEGRKRELGIKSRRHQLL
ncbi:hypothetical protein SKAU_G00175960 [Synaphobranchus kaupii]|uniref:Uncharacterized protein n=1 Tax=Synaphobranchus kaupii TaxID=118154 RepID=A0A9Q1FLF1_SYNKA|nr:hypothetical protein SKAU_G00175960 [Synaphobranchus kaupii]